MEENKTKENEKKSNFVAGEEESLENDRLEVLVQTALLSDAKLDEKCLNGLKELRCEARKYKPPQQDLGETTGVPGLDVLEIDAKCWDTEKSTDLMEGEVLGRLRAEAKKLEWEYKVREGTFRREIERSGRRIRWQEIVEKIDRQKYKQEQEIEVTSLKVKALETQERDLNEECNTYAVKLEQFRVTLQNSRSIAEKYRAKIVKVSASVSELEKTSAVLAKERKKLDERAKKVADEFAELVLEVGRCRHGEKKEMERRSRLEKLLRGFAKEREALRSEIEKMKESWRRLEHDLDAITIESIRRCAKNQKGNDKAKKTPDSQ